MIRTICPRFLLVVLISASACSDDTTSIEDIAGDYGLIQVDDASLPATTDSTQIEVTRVTGGALILDADATYSISVNCETNSIGGGSPVLSIFTDGGTFNVEESVIRLVSTTDVTWTGVVEGPAIRVAVIVTCAGGGSVELRFS